MRARLKPVSAQVMVSTGASSGIRLATTLTAAERDARLVPIARGGETLEVIRGGLRDAGAEATVCPADVADRDALEAAVQMFVETLGTDRHLDQRCGRFDLWPAGPGERRGQSAAVRDPFPGHGEGLAAAPAAPGCALINVGSEVCELVVPLQGMYSASERAVKGFTDPLRVETEFVDDAPVEVVLIQATAVDTPHPQHAPNYMAEEPKLPTPMTRRRTSPRRFRRPRRKAAATSRSVSCRR